MKQIMTSMMTGGSALLIGAAAGAQAPQGSAAAIALINAPYSRTYDPGSGASPLTLLEAPANPVAYYKDKVRARSLIDAKKFEEAEPLVERLAQRYPRDPENWTLLADTKQELKKHVESAYANARAGQLRGWDLGYAHGLRMASNYLAAGDRAGALETLARLINGRHFYWRSALYEMDEFAALRGDPQFMQLTGRLDTAGWDRVAGWRHDVDFLMEEVKRVNPDYRDKPLPAEMIRRYQSLQSAIPTLSDEQVYFGMLRTLAVLDQGHVFLMPGEGTVNRFLPLRLYAFPEGIFIVDAAREYQALIGSRVVKIGTLTADEALRRLGEASSMDGEMARVFLASYLVATYNLVGMGAASNAKSIDLEVQAPGAPSRTVSVTTAQAPQGGRFDILVAPPKAPAPLFLQHMEQKQLIRALPAHHALYLRLNAIRPSDDGQSIDQLADKLRSALASHHPADLILDLRHNNGGTTQLYPKLLVVLAGFGRTTGKRLYVLIGRRTYSAAANFVTDLERFANPIFVGEPSGECCNLYGDPTCIVLPYSHIEGELTAVKWQLSDPGDRRREIAPAVPVQLTAAAYFAGKDPPLETTLQLIASKGVHAAR